MRLILLGLPSDSPTYPKFPCISTQKAKSGYVSQNIDPQTHVVACLLLSSFPQPQKWIPSKPINYTLYPLVQGLLARTLGLLFQDDGSCPAVSRCQRAPCQALAPDSRTPSVHAKANRSKQLVSFSCGRTTSSTMFVAVEQPVAPFLLRSNSFVECSGASSTPRMSLSRA